MRWQARCVRLEIEAHARAGAADQCDTAGALLAHERDVHERAGVVHNHGWKDAGLAANPVLAWDVGQILRENGTVEPLAGGRVLGALIEVDIAAVLQHGLIATVAGCRDAAGGCADEKSDLAARGEVALHIRAALAEAGAGADVHLGVLRACLGGTRVEEDGATDGRDDEQCDTHSEPAAAPRPQARATNSRGRSSTVRGSAGGKRIHVVQKS